MTRESQSDTESGRAERLAELRERALDELLVQGAQRGDALAFEHLVQRWSARLRRHAFCLTGRHADAADVLQESWVRIVRGLKSLRDPAAFRHWAFTIVTRTAADAHRRAPKEQSQSPDVLDERPREECELGERDEAVEDVRRAVASLAAEDRVLISLRYGEGLGSAEISQILSMPRGTVRSRLHRTRELLRTKLNRRQ